MMSGTVSAMTRNRSSLTRKVLKWVRESGFDGSLNIYVLSGSNEPSDVKRARELGASEYITKPITEQKLKQLFGRWAKGGSRH